MFFLFRASIAQCLATRAMESGESIVDWANFAMIRSEIQKLLRAIRTGRNTSPIKAFWGCRCVEVDTLFDGKG